MRNDGNNINFTHIAVDASPVSANNPYRQDVELGDFNVDTKLDIAITYSISNEEDMPYGVSVLFNNFSVVGEPSFVTPRIPVGGPYQSVDGLDLTIADVDNNGIPDIVAVRGAVPRVDVVRSVGNGSFDVSQHTLTHGGVMRRLAVGDVNGDNELDVVATDSNYDGICTLLNEGDASSFTRVSNIDVVEPYQIALHDFNGDNKTDMLVAQASGSILFYKNHYTGSGTDFFYTPRDITECYDVNVSIAPTLYFEVADINDDSVLDVVVFADVYDIYWIDGTGQWLDGA